ncbi:MAG: 50S ribosomal protein L7ae [Firmicutes bacterium]|nr:50S ribosomal protein L7ae [Bacillota bacterium]
MTKLLSFLGIAQKAGKLTLGFTATAQAAKGGKLSLVLLATDTAWHTKEKVERLCRTYQIRWYCLAKREELGRALGKETLAVVGVLAPEMAQAIEEQLLTARME